MKPKGGPPKNPSAPGDKRFFPSKTKKPGVEQWIPGAPPPPLLTTTAAANARAPAQGGGGSW